MSERIFSFRGEDNWSDYSYPEEALQEMDDNDALEVGIIFRTGIKQSISSTRYFPDAEDVLERYDENVLDNHDWSYAEGNTGTDTLKDEAKAELDSFLKKWADTYLTVTFFEIDHEEEIEVTQEMINAFHANAPIPLPEFKHKEPSHG